MYKTKQVKGLNAKKLIKGGSCVPDSKIVYAIDLFEKYNLDNSRNARAARFNDTCKAMVKQVYSAPELFAAMNNGITLIMPTYGATSGFIANGGHTVKALQYVYDRDPEQLRNVMVRLDIIVTSDTKLIVDITKGRNTATPVSRLSLLVHSGKIDSILDWLRDKPWFKLKAARTQSELTLANILFALSEDNRSQALSKHIKSVLQQLELDPLRIKLKLARISFIMSQVTDLSSINKGADLKSILLKGSRLRDFINEHNLDVTTARDLQRYESTFNTWLTTTRNK
jgi:hypothetical protein